MKMHNDVIILASAAEDTRALDKSTDFETYSMMVLAGAGAEEAVDAAADVWDHYIHLAESGCVNSAEIHDVAGEYSSRYIKDTIQRALFVDSTRCEDIARELLGKMEIFPNIDVIADRLKCFSRYMKEFERVADSEYENEAVSEVERVILSGVNWEWGVLDDDGVDAEVSGHIEIGEGVQISM